ncbi:MAG: hypothetical protein ACI9N1_003106 [Flavobacteriales bacterium]
MTSKKNVLIIDDMDRILPDHLFRILNVISAHSGSYYYDNEEDKNKFGFDKVIIVGDIQNFESSFKHNYGDQFDFFGYIDKFYSIEPFPYDNSKTIQELLNRDFEELRISGFDLWSEELLLFVRILAETGGMSVRDAISLKHHSFRNVYESMSFKPELMCRSDFFIPVFEWFTKVWSIEEVETRFIKCFDNTLIVNKQYLEKFSGYLLNGIESKRSHDEKGTETYFKLKNGDEIIFDISKVSSVGFRIELDTGNIEKIINNKGVVEISSTVILNVFKELLKEKIKYYKKLN